MGQLQVFVRIRSSLLGNILYAESACGHRPARSFCSLVHLQVRDDLPFLLSWGEHVAG